MRYLTWLLRVILLTLIFAFLHYTLPQHDIVRVTNTYEKRIDFGARGFFWAGGTRNSDGTLLNRDVFFIETFKTNEAPMIFRNEDTGWGWPPYFKFDTSNLQAEASDMMGKAALGDTKWIVVRHYGWRNEFFSIYPNAVSLRLATGPHERIIPWVKIAFLTVLVAVFWALWMRWVRFRIRKIDPILEQWENRFEQVGIWVRSKLNKP
jgi:hypothetical protein